MTELGPKINSSAESIPTLTLEQKENIIKNHLIDIKKYEGLLQYTQVANLESLLSEGLKKKGNKIWGAEGWINRNWNTGHGIYFTYKYADTSFDNWNLSYSKIGPVAVLFKEELIDEVDLYQAFEVPGSDGRVSSEGTGEVLTAEEKESFKLGGGTVTLHTDGETTIRKDYVHALVLSPKAFTLERNERDALTSKDKLMVVQPEQLLDMALHRLNRLSEKDKNLVPVYDCSGNMLWPEKISYENIKDMIRNNENS